MPDPLITLHVCAGAVGLVAGPLAAAAGLAAPGRRRLHLSAGWTYQGSCALLCLTALGLVARDVALWGFAVIAVLTELAATAAVVVRRRHAPGWRPQHVQLALGSWVSFLTAFVVQTTDGLWWVVPVAAGSAAVAAVTARVARAPAAV